MPTKRRTTSRSRINRAVKAGRSALREAEKRIPPDLRRQIESGIKDGQKRFDAAVKDIRTRISKATAPGEIDRAAKRFRSQVEGLAKMVTARATSASRATTRRRSTTTRRASTSKAKTTRKAAAARKPAARKPAARRTSPRRKAATPVVVTPPPAVPEPPMGPMGGLG